MELTIQDYRNVIKIAKEAPDNELSIYCELKIKELQRKKKSILDSTSLFDAGKEYGGEGSDDIMYGSQK